MQATPRDGRRERLGQGAQPTQLVYRIEGSLAAAMAVRQARIRKALKDRKAAFPDQQSTPIQNPTARWVFLYFAGIHVLLIPGQWPLVMNLTEEHQHLLRLHGKPYMGFYGVKYA